MLFIRENKAMIDDGYACELMRHVVIVSYQIPSLSVRRCQPTSASWLSASIGGGLNAPLLAQTIQPKW